MRRVPLLTALLAAAVCSVASVLARPAQADVEATVLNRQKIAGFVFPDEDIRLFLPMARGTEGKLKLTVSGSNVPVSFSSGLSQLLDPDGLPVPEDENLEFGAQTIKKRKSTFRIQRLVAQKTGVYTLVLKTNTRVRLEASGKWKVKRDKVERFEGDENSANFPVEMQQGDAVKIKLKTESGDPPRVALFVTPSGASFPPTQTLNKKGAKTRKLQAGVTGTFGVDVDYQIPGVAGAYSGKLIFSVVKGLGTARLRRTNPPGVALSVLPSDRIVNADFGDTGIGILTPSRGIVTLTSVRNGTLFGKNYDDNLQPIITQPNPVALVQASDLQPGEVVGGHRVDQIDNGMVAVYTSASGAEVGLVRFNQSLQVLATRQFIVGSAADLREPFLTPNRTADGLFLGLFLPPSGHTVYELDNQFNDVTSHVIGVGGFAHGSGGVAQWSEENQVFELWAPDTTLPGVASDLHRQFYSQVWDPTGADETPVADQSVSETFPTALSIDEDTSASIVHYVVTTNAQTGTGQIHRRIYDKDGVEVPGSHKILSDGAGDPLTGLNRPTSRIDRNFLFVGFETTNGPQVLRYTLLR